MCLKPGAFSQVGSKLDDMKASQQSFSSSKSNSNGETHIILDSWADIFIHLAPPGAWTMLDVRKKKEYVFNELLLGWIIIKIIQINNKGHIQIWRPFKSVFGATNPKDPTTTIVYASNCAIPLQRDLKLRKLQTEIQRRHREQERNKTKDKPTSRIGEGMTNNTAPR